MEKNKNLFHRYIYISHFSLELCFCLNFRIWWSQISHLEGVINLRIIDTRRKMTSRQDRRCYRRFIRMFVPSFSLFQPFCYVSFPFSFARIQLEPRLKRWRARNFLFLLATRHEFHRSPSLSSARAFSLLEMHCSSVCRRLCFRKRNGIPMPAENRFPRRNTDGSNACFFFKNRFRIIRRTINYFLKILSLLFILNSLSLFFSYSIHDIHEPKNLLRHAKCWEQPWRF